MGTFRWPLHISSMDGQQAQEVEATVDTGAAYTTLPGSLLRELGIKPMDKGVFLLADGRRVEMDIGRAWATVDGSSEVTLVVFGEDDAPALLGAYTLEGLRLAVTPLHSDSSPPISSCTSTGSPNPPPNLVGVGFVVLQDVFVVDSASHMLRLGRKEGFGRRF